MYPVLLALGGYSVATFGVALGLAAILGLFIIWRLTLVYDLDKEKVIDLSLISLLSGFIFARITFVLLNLSSFDNFSKAVLVNLYPGLFLWGGLLGGAIAAYFLSSKLKLNFWQIVDFATVALFLALSIGGIGCLLGSCHYGPESKLQIAVFQSGVIGKRFPLQIFESIIFGIAFIYLWRSVLRFHFNGQIVSKGLILLGLFKMTLGFFQKDQTFIGVFPIERALALVCILLGFVLNYLLGKRSLKLELKQAVTIITNPNRRKVAISKFKKSCYNLQVDTKISMQRWRKRLLKLLHVKPNPTQF